MSIQQSHIPVCFWKWCESWLSSFFYLLFLTFILRWSRHRWNRHLNSLTLLPSVRLPATASSPFVCISVSFSLMLYPQTLPPPLTELFLHLMTNDSLGHASPRGVGFRGPAFRDPLHQQVHSPTGPFYFWQAPHCKHLPQECQKVLLFPQALSGGTSQAHTQLWILLNYLWMSWLWHFGSIASDNVKLVRTLLYSFHVLNSQWQPTLPLSLKHGTNSSLGPNIKDQWSCVLYNSINILWRTPVKWWSDSRLGPKGAKTGSTNVQNHNLKKPQLQQEA